MKLLYFPHDIQNQSIESLMTRMRCAHAPEGILIDSSGGKFTFFSVRGPAIARQGIPMLAGGVKSAAVILYLLGYPRYVTPTSTFWLHEARALVAPYLPAITLTDAEEVEAHARQLRGKGREAFEQWKHNLEIAQSWAINFIAEASGMDRPTLLRLMREEAVLSAEDAIHYGIATGYLPKNVQELQLIPL